VRVDASLALGAFSVLDAVDRIAVAELYLELTDVRRALFGQPRELGLQGFIPGNSRSAEDARQRKRGKCLIRMVAGDRIELPTRGFSILWKRRRGPCGVA